MDPHPLNDLFNPQSIAVIGASDRPDSVGKLVFSNILNGQYAGQLFPVNKKHTCVQGYTAYASVQDIAATIDLAIITTPAETITEIMTQCGKKGVKIIIIISAGFSEQGKQGQQLERKILQIAHKYHIRIIGPNCLGFIRPAVKLNATFDNNNAFIGTTAFISQSGAMIAAVLDWAQELKIGFSTVISLGNAADLDFGEILDFLALDTQTESILLYIEGIHNARSFMSGLRTAARMKPVIVVKAGRYGQGIRAAHSHTGVLVGNDDVFDTALRRAGAVRVMSIEQLFSAVHVFSSPKRCQGNKLSIITNGGGAGVLAADKAAELNIPLPKPNKEMLAALNAKLPKSWSHQNPIDIIGDATPKRYQETIEICLKNADLDGLLVILIPVAMTDPIKVAKQIIISAKKTQKPLLVCCMGGMHIQRAKKLFAKHNIPYFSTPEEAVEAFFYLTEYQRNQTLLQQVPAATHFYFQPELTIAQSIFNTAISENRTILTTIETKKVLSSFGIPTTIPIEAHSLQMALAAAKSIPPPWVMKINSPDITHKQEAQGVKLNIDDVSSIETLFNKMIADAKQYQPDAKILGVTLEPMLQTINDRELMIGMIRDPVFGPAISLGIGGSLVEIIHDIAIALPPLNHIIIQQLIARTHLATLLGPFRGKLAANQDALITTLLKISYMICEFPQIQEMDINPLIINDQEIMAVDARMVINHSVSSTPPYQHLAIFPYPNHLISSWTLPDKTPILIRPIRPEDAKLEQDFIKSLSEKTKYLRFMGHIDELSPTMLIRFTQIDYDREMALVAIVKENSKEMIIGIARYTINPDMQTCEFALVIADAWQNKGLGHHLMLKLMDIAKTKHLTSMIGHVFASNHDMLILLQNLGFSIQQDTQEPSLKIVSKSLDFSHNL